MSFFNVVSAANEGHRNSVVETLTSEVRDYLVDHKVDIPVGRKLKVSFKNVAKCDATRLRNEIASSPEMYMYSGPAFSYSDADTVTRNVLVEFAKKSRKVKDAINPSLNLDHTSYMKVFNILESSQFEEAVYKAVNFEIDLINKIKNERVVVVDKCSDTTVSGVTDMLVLETRVENIVRKIMAEFDRLSLTGSKTIRKGNNPFQLIKYADNTYLFIIALLIVLSIVVYFLSKR